MTSARAAVLTVGTIVAVAASKAGDISQDLKTGYLVGATPARQQFGQLIGASFACWAVAGTVILLGSVYTFGSRDIPAPQATLMKTIIEGVLAGALPWGLVLVRRRARGCGVPLQRVAAGVRDRRLPAAGDDGGHLSGRLRAGAERARARDQERRRRPPTREFSPRRGWSLAKGSRAWSWPGWSRLRCVPRTMAPRLPGVAGEIGVIALLLGICFFLHHAGRAARKPVE